MDLRETRKGKTGDSKYTHSFQGVFLRRGTKKRGNWLRGGVDSRFCGMGEITHVCTWMGTVDRVTLMMKEKEEGDGCSLGSSQQKH